MPDDKVKYQSHLYMKQATLLLSPRRLGKSATMQEMQDALVRGVTAHDYLISEVWGMEPRRTLRRIERRMRVRQAWARPDFIYGPSKSKPKPASWPSIRDAHTLTYRRDLGLTAANRQMDVSWLLRRVYKWSMLEIEPQAELLLRVNYSEQLTGRKLARPLTWRGLP